MLCNRLQEVDLVLGVRVGDPVVISEHVLTAWGPVGDPWGEISFDDAIEKLRVVLVT